MKNVPYNKLSTLMKNNNLSINTILFISDLKLLVTVVNIRISRYHCGCFIEFWLLS